MLPSNVKDKILSTYAKSKDSIELEARFGQFGKSGFKPGVSRQIFNRIKSYFDEKAQAVFSETTDYIMENVRKSVKLEDTEEDVEWITKTRLWNLSLEEYNIRYSMATEITIDPIADHLFIPQIVRNKKRSSYFLFGKAVRLDITITTTDNKKYPEYEIEIELLDRAKLSEFEKAVETILRLVLDTVKIYTNTLKNQVISEINKSLGSDKWGILDHYPLVQARNLKLRDMVWGGLIGNEKTGYSVTHKADGQRRLLTFLSSGIWLVSAPSTLSRISDTAVPNLTGTILDGELIPKDKRLEGSPKAFYWYLAFDALAYNFDSSIQAQPHGKRMFYAQSVADVIKTDILTVNTKSFRNISTPQEFFAIMREMFREQPLLAYKQDGFMFTPQNVAYNPHSDSHPLFTRILTKYPDICKWKPKEELTIDFLVQNGEAGTRLYSNQKGTPVIFRPAVGKYDAFDPMTKDLPDNTIVEYAYDYDSELLYPTRIRHDKDKPNSIEIAEDVWSDITTPLDKTTLEGNDFTLLRRYHNRIKRELLSINRKCLLDIGSGRGGDVNKWKGFDRIVAVEPNPEHIIELEKRLVGMDMREKVLILQSGGEETERITTAVREWCGGRVDVVTSMLSLTFFWQSSQLVDQLCNTILMNIKPKGEFIFLTMDGNLVEQTFEPAFGTGLVLDKLKFGEIATLEYFGDKSPKELHIHISDSIVTDQTEWLVRLEDLKIRMGKYGFDFTMMEKADKERFLTEDEIIMTQMYTYGKLAQVRDVALPELEELSVSKPIQKPIEKFSSKVPKKLAPLKKLAPSPKKTIEILPMDKVKKIDVNWWEERAVSIGTIANGDCMIHSVLNAYLAYYQSNPDVKFRTNFVKKLRQEMAERLEMPDPNYPGKTYYETAVEGQFVELYQQQQMGLNIEELIGQDFDFSLEGLKNLFDSCSFLGDEVYSYFADLLNLDIYILRIDSEGLHVHANTYQEGSQRKAVVIVGSGLHFETLGILRTGRYQTVFLPNDPFLIKIRSFSK